MVDAREPTLSDRWIGNQVFAVDESRRHEQRQPAMRAGNANQSLDCPENDDRCHQGDGQEKRVPPRRELWSRLSLGARSGRRLLLLAGQRESFLSETGDGLIDKYRRRPYLYGTPPANFIVHALTISRR